MSDIERDGIIFNACAELREFRDFLDFKEIDGFTKIIQSPPPDNVFPKILWDSNFVEQSIQRVKQMLMAAISNDILKNMQSRKLNDPLYVGGSYSIALRLCLSYFFRHEKIENINNLPGWFLSDCKFFNMDFFSFVRMVEKEYEIKFMRYRLWDDKSIKALDNYIFLSYKDHEEFEYPPIREHYDPLNGILTKNEFVELLVDILVNYPMENCCEIRFPPYDEDGYIFAEFVPVEDMPNRYIDLLYNSYLQVFAHGHK